MIKKSIYIVYISIFICILFSFINVQNLFPHCDTMNGPVIVAAKKALETGNVNLILIWVQPKDEAEIKKAFQKTLSVRKLNSEAKDFADMYFFEILVRIHRAGEGFSYTGIKPSEVKIDPIIDMSDKSLEQGSIEKLQKQLLEVAKNNIQKYFNNVNLKKKFKIDEVNSGRDFVKSYVEYVHYIERLHQAINNMTDNSVGDNDPCEHHDSE